VLLGFAPALDFAECLNARSAELLRNRLALFEDLHLLDVDLPLRSSGFLGPGPVVAKLRALTAIFALSHFLTPYFKNVVDPINRDEQRQCYRKPVSGQSNTTKKGQVGPQRPANQLFHSIIRMFGCQK
jgi:hypothetical protein